MDSVTARTPPSAAHRPMLTARLLGRFEVVLGGSWVDTRSSRRTRNVLAYLLIHRHAPVPRDVLMAAFWPDSAPDAARNSLHVALTGVRAALRGATPGPVLQRTYDTYGFSPAIDIWVDTDEFERQCADGRGAERAGDDEAAVRNYEEAAQLYDGALLAEDPYLDWVAATRERLALLAAETRARLVELYVDRGDDAAAMALARWILAEDDCNETVHRALMRCYQRAGRGHLAAAQYHRCAQSLRQGLGVAPSPQTRALYEQLRAGAPALRRGTESTARSGGTPRGPLAQTCLALADRAGARLAPKLLLWATITS